MVVVVPRALANPKTSLRSKRAGQIRAAVSAYSCSPAQRSKRLRFSQRCRRALGRLRTNGFTTQIGTDASDERALFAYGETTVTIRLDASAGG